MKKILSQRIMAGATGLGLAALLALPSMAGALITANQVPADKGLEATGNFAKNTGLGQGDIKGTTASIINVVLGVLGIIAVVIILAGGFKWMTAGGNEDKVGEAKKLITQGAIGLVIIFAAWGIASFVISQLTTATSN
jgi:hypothetical protein